MIYVKSDGKRLSKDIKKSDNINALASAMAVKILIWNYSFHLQIWI